MTTHSPDVPAPVLILVPGAAGAPADGGARFHVADETAPQLAVTDLVATRGDGVFETIGAFDGVPVNVIPHLERLARSAAMVDLPAPDLETVVGAVEAAIAAHEPVSELSVRVYTRGIEGTGTPTCWIHARVSDDWAPYRAGMKVALLDRGLPTTSAQTSPWLLPGAKTLSYAVNMAAVREAKRRGAADVLFVASDGYVLEGPTSTLLVRRGDEFLTTPVSAGVLAGTSVRSLSDHLEAERGTGVREQLMTIEDVTGSDGAWLLSSTRLAAPITHLDEAELPVDRALTARFQQVLTGAI